MRTILPIFALTVGCLLAPFVLLYKFLFDRNGLQNIFDISQKDWLSDKQHIHRIQFTTTETTPLIAAHEQTCETVGAFVAEQNWIGLADYLITLDQDRVKTPGNKTLSIVALRHFSHLAHIPGNVGVETSDGLPARLAALNTQHPEKYALAAMSAMLRLQEAWAARGDGYANSVSKRNWQIAENRAEYADRLLSKTDPKILNSPLLAYCQFQLLPFVPDATERYLPYYHIWTNLDPICQQPHEEVGFKLLPRWFGNLNAVEDMARHAAAQSPEEVGQAPYFTMFKQAIGCEPIQLVIDPDMFAAGVRDFLALRAYDQAAVLMVYYDLDALVSLDAPKQANTEQAERWAASNAKLRALQDDILARHVTQIYTPGWDGGVVEALNRITDCFRAEMDAGHHFTLSSDGITTHATTQSV